MMSGRGVLRIYVYIMFGIMILPLLIVLPVALTKTSYMTFPPVGLTLKWFGESLRDRILLTSIVRSLQLATLSAGVVVFTSFLAAFVLARKRFPGRSVLETFFTGPRVIPLIILVLGLLIFYYSIGLSGTFLGLAFSHLVITVPFAFRTIMASISSVDIYLEWSARILGANALVTFLKIILPQVKTGIIAAFMFAFITSFNNVTMALFLSAPGQRTLPVELFMRLQIGGITPKTPAMSFILALAGLVLFVVMDKTLGIYRYLGAAE